MGFSDLPDDILIIVLKTSVPHVLFSLYSTNRRLKALIQKYCGPIIKSITRGYLPELSQIETSHKHLIFSTREDMAIIFLAVAIAEKFVYPRAESEHQSNTSANNASRQYCLTQLVTGLRLLQCFSAISKKVFAMAPEQIPPPPDSRKRGSETGYPAAQVVRKREHEIYRRRIACVSQRPIQSRDCAAYVYNVFLLNTTARRPPRNGDSNSPLDAIERSMINYFDIGGSSGKAVRDGKSWLNWFILHEGPALFWHQWIASWDGEYMKKKALQAWQMRSIEEIEMERSYGVRFQVMFGSMLHSQRLVSSGGSLLPINLVSQITQKETGSEPKESDGSPEYGSLLDEVNIFTCIGYSGS